MLAYLNTVAACTLQTVSIKQALYISATRLKAPEVHGWATAQFWAVYKLFMMIVSWYTQTVHLERLYNKTIWRKSDVVVLYIIWEKSCRAANPHGWSEQLSSRQEGLGRNACLYIHRMNGSLDWMFILWTRKLCYIQWRYEPNISNLQWNYTSIVWGSKVKCFTKMWTTSASIFQLMWWGEYAAAVAVRPV